ncbi:hypothetical protein TNCV_3296021 [Trichonephila clavipes]|uniref:Uncharacterized protein n=1 Tax=Trichonephila clavipes TaxID=2585209 RepID=A0A8X6T2A1_TRICX|nr:hypothetical protein TNCV_3296021 [Trichonephila clavipes]
MSTNQDARYQTQANQRQVPNSLSMGRRNASRSSAQCCPAIDEEERILEKVYLVTPHRSVDNCSTRLRSKGLPCWILCD